jgi:hypothetical protein
MGLPTDAIIGIQLPNVVENILTILGVMRAGMIPAPLPLLWRRADTIAALARLGGKALITCGHVGAFHHCQFALRVAVEVFSIRYVCGFGMNLPDGVVAFDDLFSAATLDPAAPLDRDRQDNSAAHVAAISFDIGEHGVVAVARTHFELLAGGLEVLLESAVAQDTNILSTFAPASFAGMCLTLLPWLLSGGALVLHHPFDADLLNQQWREERCGALIVPAAIAFRLADAGAFTHAPPASIIAPWRAPELLATSPVWSEQQISFVDVAIFGETGLLAARRAADGGPAPIPLGLVGAPRAGPDVDAVMVAETVLTDAGTLALRGPMVPHHTFPPGVERSGLPHFQIGRGGLVDTGYACRVDSGGKTISVTAAPSGIVSVGGYRFPLHDLQDVIGRVDAGALLTALPDPLVGQRLIGTAADRDTVQAALNTVGINPLVVAAFGPGGARSVPGNA